MNVEQLGESLSRRLPQIKTLNLDPRCISVRHVMNWGGFVNHSFHVSDGSVRYHLKLTNDLDNVRKLQVWYSLRRLLERRYRSPEVIHWLDLPDLGFHGLLQQHVDGKTANFSDNTFLVQQLIELLSRLHSDDEIALHLRSSNSAKTYFDHFVETYIERFTADMQEIAKKCPQFVSPELFTWMENETVHLRQIAAADEAFDNIAANPVHGDLNEGNVLTTTRGWFVVDWDDTALGDPALDFAVLLWPMVWQGRKWREFSLSAVTNDFEKRLDICLRAQLLDEVIDPLADYVAAHLVPARESEIRFAKRARHEEALHRYRNWYSR